MKSVLNDYDLHVGQYALMVVFCIKQLLSGQWLKMISNLDGNSPSQPIYGSALELFRPKNAVCDAVK